MCQGRILLQRRRTWALSGEEAVRVLSPPAAEGSTKEHLSPVASARFSSLEGKWAIILPAPHSHQPCTKPPSERGPGF